MGAALSFPFLAALQAVSLKFFVYDILSDRISSARFSQNSNNEDLRVDKPKIRLLR